MEHFAASSENSGNLIGCNNNCDVKMHFTIRTTTLQNWAGVIQIDCKRASAVTFVLSFDAAIVTTFVGNRSIRMEQSCILGAS